ncbi:MAG: phosphoribosylaminoimidazole-succinocarboxamide synthase, partial [Flavobacteriales bacterium]
DFQGKEGQVQPDMDDAFIDLVTNRYVELYEIMTGQNFVKEDVSDKELIGAMGEWARKSI